MISEISLSFKCALIVLFVTVVTACYHVSAWAESEWSAQSPFRTFYAKGCDLMDQFAYINQILEKNVRTEDDDANFKHIDSLLQPRWTLMGRSSEGGAMREALLLFRSLKQLNEGKTNQCNIKTYNILKRNYNAANGLPQWGYERVFAKRRINKIVRGFVERNAATCQPLYIDLYKEQIKKVDPSQKELAETLVKNLIFKRHGQEEGSEILGNAQKLLKFGQEYSMTHKIINDCAYCLQEMRRLTKNDPNSKYVEPQPTEWLGRQILEVNKEELSKLFVKYIHKPCKEYVIKLEPIFMLADFNSRFLVEPAKQDELDYYLNWAAFELCDIMALYEATVPLNIAEYADRMAKKGLPF